ncbi:hypothetical protein DMH15_12680 [Streptomyces sp. WAC 06725]|uniref:hypothetical protein n=1 Tax=Streptomyces sp. WAC 06725 TaxID=2203209 RepID=UPI000F74B571|nr:hypothetical protein [Streptomyces sp. WAC 06725]RSO41845.1 hypothetical protein DMH15_12680 [Streptomyces sp. WAC 06725]
MLGFTWGRPLRASRRTRPAPDDTDPTPAPPAVPPVPGSGRGISFDWGKRLELHGAHLLTWWVQHTRLASGAPESGRTSEGGQAQHAMHAVDLLYLELCQLDVAAGHPLRLELDHLRQVRARQQYAEYLTSYACSLSISVVTEDGTRHALAVRCRAAALPVFASGADVPEGAFVGGAV